jgi:hypothetical protein
VSLYDFEYVMFREESIIARARQVLGIANDREPKIKQHFLTRIAKYHPDKRGPRSKEHAEVLIEAYQVLTGRIKPSECPLLENDDLVASLLPAGVKPVKLGIKYDEWVKDRFYDFVKP